MNLKPNKTDLFFLKISGRKSKQPDRDYLTQGLLDLIAHPGTHRIIGDGLTVCPGCGFSTQNCHFTLPSGQNLHALGVHYLLWHRDELPLEEMGKVCYHMSKHLKPKPPERIATDESVAQWSFPDQVYIAPSGKEYSGVLNVRYSADGVILDLADQLGEVIATNGLDLDTLCQMLKPNRPL